MKASETKLAKIVEGTNQYLVPHYQRPYTWTPKHWKTLWSDLEELAEPDTDSSPQRSKQHFMGSLVTAPGNSVPEGVSKWVLIDGQQRLTTLLLLLAAIRDHARAVGRDRLGAQIHDLYLTNQYQEGPELFKLLPTTDSAAAGGDRGAFISIIQGETPAPGNIQKAHQFFRDRLAAANSPDADRLKQVIVGNLVLVSIVLERDDNPYLVFESLNAKGQQLTQADLIRNYFFMRLRLERHDHVYNGRWRPLEERLGQGNTTEFIRHFLMKNGGVIKINDLYFEIKQRLDAAEESAVLELLDQLHAASKHYACLLEPAKEPDTRIRAGIERLNRIEATVAYPFLLNVYEAYEAKRVSYDDFVDILATIENFILRRYVCRTQRAELNKLFPGLYRLAQNYTSIAKGIRDILSGRSYPTDAQFQQELSTSVLYGTGEKRERVKLILERLEDSYEHKERVPFENLTVEHVMPQTLTPWWRQHLGDDADETHDAHLHTLGNLTLTGTNSELSNLPFTEKRKILSDSHLELNRDLAGLGTWTETEIEQRGNQLALRALQIWPDLKPHREGRTAAEKVTGATPRRLTIYGQVHDVETWQGVLQITVTEMANLGDDVFQDIAEQFSRWISRDASKMRTPKQLKNGFFYETHLNAKQINRTCKGIVQVAGLASEEWFVDCD